MTAPEAEIGLFINSSGTPLTFFHQTLVKFVSPRFEPKLHGMYEFGRGSRRFTAPNPSGLIQEVTENSPLAEGVELDKPD
jgi:hypothetical protein